MEDKFGNVGDTDTKSFSSSNEEDTSSAQSGADITTEDLKELRKRDVNAQEHIPQLETENNQLRAKLAEVETQLEGSATLEDVLNRIENKSEGGSTVSADEVATQVEARLQSRAKEEQQESNWNTVWGKLQEQHGSEENVDKYVLTQAATLGMSTEEATLLAKNSPDAFMKLFSAEGTAAPQQGIASATGQQTSNNNEAGTSSGTKDKAFYDEMLRKNPRKYWKVATQAQLRRDVYGET